MSTTTTNYGLIKPERSDNYNVDVMGNNMDIIDTKIAKLEAGEFETITTNSIKADIIQGDISSCFNAVALTSNEIGLVSFSSSKTFVSASSNVNGSSGYGTWTYTYRANPFINTVKFIASKSNASIYVKVNGVTILNGATNGISYTFSDGDIIVINATNTSTKDNMYVSNATIKMTWNCYILSNF